MAGCPGLTVVPWRLQTRPQFQAVLAADTVARTRHFALHRLRLTPDHLLFSPHSLWLGAMAPKRWARRAVTRNAIRRQIYALAPAEGWAPHAAAGPVAYVLRLRSAVDQRSGGAKSRGADRSAAAAVLRSASSPQLKRAVRAELITLWQRAGVAA